MRPAPAPRAAARTSRVPRAASGPPVAALLVAMERAPGERFTPALAQVRRRPLYAWSVDRLAAAPAINETRVLLPARARFERVVAASDWRSVSACPVSPANLPPFTALLEALSALDGAVERVLVHDAAYPLLDARSLDAVLAAGSATHLVLAATPVKDTLKQVDAQGLVTGTPPRDRLWQVRSPVLAPRALLEPRLRALAGVAPAQPAFAAGWLRELCAGLPTRIVPIGADAPHVRTRADARALAEVLSEMVPST
jgi:2-C-methyl-D-erythritol 4-phosphate cytidylyltransferase